MEELLTPECSWASLTQKHASSYRHWVAVKLCSIWLHLLASLNNDDNLTSQDEEKLHFKPHPRKNIKYKWQKSRDNKWFYSFSILMQTVTDAVVNIWLCSTDLHDLFPNNSEKCVNVTATGVHWELRSLNGGWPADLRGIFSVALYLAGWWWCPRKKRLQMEISDLLVSHVKKSLAITTWFIFTLIT